MRCRQYVVGKITNKIYIYQQRGCSDADIKVKSNKTWIISSHIPIFVEYRHKYNLSMALPILEFISCNSDKMTVVKNGVVSFCIVKS